MKILFISHEASRSGAPILLLELIKALQEHLGIAPVILLKNGGPLEDEFRKAGETHILIPRKHKLRSLLKLVKLGFRYLKTARLPAVDGSLYIKPKEAARITRGVKLVIANTIAAADIVRSLKISKDIKVISYIHELDLAAQLVATEKNAAFLLERSAIVMVPSHAVFNYISSRYRVPPEKIREVPYIILQRQYLPKNELRKKYQVGEHDFIVCGCGKIEWRKGTDYFLSVAHRILKKGLAGNIEFIWIGADKASIAYRIAMEKINKSGMDKLVRIEEVMAGANEYIGIADVFLLPSVEDPYPLVVLEAAAHAIPTICFDKAGGAPEFVENDAGIIVDYLDVEAMADAILLLKDDPVLLRQKGLRAKEKLEKLHAKEHVITRMRSLLEELYPS